jgi:hypothetical protein
VYVLALPERAPGEGLLLVLGELPQVANGEVAPLLLATSLLPPTSYTSPPLPFPVIRNSFETSLADPYVFGPPGSRSPDPLFRGMDPGSGSISQRHR